MNIDPSRVFDILSWKTEPLSACFLATGSLLILTRLELVAFGKPFDTYFQNFLWIVLLVSAAALLVNVVAFVPKPWIEKRKVEQLSARRTVRAKERDEEIKQRQATVIRRLDYLSDNEVKLLADPLQANSNSFTGWFHNPHIGTLKEKGIVYAPAGVSYHQDHFPFLIHDFVWEELLNRKDQIADRLAEIREQEERREQEQPRSRGFR